MILCLLLTGCSGTDSRKSKETAGAFLTAYSNLDDRTGEYLSTGRGYLEFEGFQVLLVQNITLTVEGTHKEEDICWVETQVRNADFKKAFEDAYSEASEGASEDAVLRRLVQALQEDTVPLREFSVDIPVRKYGQEYRIELTGQLSNALLGGYNEYLSALLTSGGSEND